MLFSKLAGKCKSSWLSLAGRFRQHEHSATTRATTRVAAPATATATNTVPGILFVLPYDLLELIATVFFQRREAVKVLCVNSQFHHAFSRIVWHSLFIDDTVFTDIPAAPWKNYGHLVRVMRFEYYLERAEVDAELFPNLIELRLSCSQLLNSNIKRNQLRKLRRLNLVSPWNRWTRSDAVKYVDAVQRWMQHSNCSLHVNWEIEATAGPRQNNMDAIDCILSTIGREGITNHTFSITLCMDHPVILTQLPLLADSLTKMYVGRSAPGFNCFLSNNSSSSNSNDDDANLIFPCLKSISIDGLALLRSESRRRVSNITPNQLPSLEELSLRTNQDTLDPGWFADIFEYTWSTLTTAAFYCCCSVTDFQTAISHTPNLLHLSLLECAFTLDVSILATQTPHLKDLSLGSRLAIDLGSAQYQQSQRSLTALRRLHLSYDYGTESGVFVTRNALQFITRVAPGLACIRFDDFRGISNSDLDAVRGTVNPAVRSLDVDAPRYDLDFTTVQSMMALFPNLTLLDIKGKKSVYKTKSKLRQKYPKLAIF
ncbi:hypothetical protein GQ42DRAFT_19368 [Ramicandelaber brevisporus]|nr:hypothetical protein GQ42DRAFT_19368 [Ramicandelaber brevisporus]